MTEPQDLTALVAMMPFAETLGVELEAATAAEVTGRVAWAPDLCTTFGTLARWRRHGRRRHASGPCPRS